ncbi:class I SAM-dependent methyltransferase [Devosia sp. Root635]|uniref:class I SAM-dependent methyltransferase n=1 Tax=Devosia sp. Root635 TaxID=1736575 RepID=UPI0006F7B01D|nr:class I SAM-dependent methyltransferase [Devosia sp. Root635]KRA53067.1 hypothetical protein ASD80_13825 [Devosia sp. Root635]
MGDGKPAAFAYDEVAYPAPILSMLTPDRLGAAGAMHGWRAPRPQTASYLEIGCGDGYNLIGIGAVTPEGRHVGFDLSSAAAARGATIAAAAGLANVDIQAGDILDYPREGEKFDYIVSHGVYTWIPQHVRPALLELIGRRLAPGGVAYVSFDALPAAAPKAYIHDFLMRELAGVEGLEARSEKAVRLLAMLKRNQRPESRLAGQLDQLINDLPDFEPGYFFHDWLAEFYAPVSLDAFGAAAAEHGLVRAGDAAMYDMFVGDLDDEARATVEACGDDIVRRSELVFALRGAHVFRREMLVRADAPPPRLEWSEAVRSLSFGYSGTREPVEDEAGAGFRYTFGPSNFVIVRDAATIGVIDELLDAAPDERMFDQLADATGLPPDMLGAILLKLGTMALIDVHATPQRFVTAAGDYPRAGALIRSMLMNGEVAISLRHRRLVEENIVSRTLMALCDGTRSRDELAMAMAELFDMPIDRAKIDEALTYFARHRMLEA